MNRKTDKIINFIFFTGIWVQPVLFALIVIFLNEVGASVSSSQMLSILSVSFLPSGFIFSQNYKQKLAGKDLFGIEDTLHMKDSQYNDPARYQAVHPKISDSLIFDKPTGVVLGKIERGSIFKEKTRYICQPLVSENRKDGLHFLVLGATGSGKSATVAISSLLCCRAENIGLFCIDIKGELSNKSFRVDDSSLVVIDFDDRSDSKWGYDALWILNQKEKPTSQDILSTFRRIAECLVPVSAKDKDQFWKLSARSLFTGLCIGAYSQLGIHNLSAIINYILSNDIGGLVKSLVDGARPGSSELKYLSSFYRLVDVPETFQGIAQNMSESIRLIGTDENIRYSFEVNKKKANPGMPGQKKAVFLSVKQQKLQAYSPVICLILSQLFDELSLRPEGADPVLIIIDEFSTITSKQPLAGYQEFLFTSRSRNVSTLTITQSLSGLSQYNQQAIDSIISNMSYIAVLNSKSLSDAKMICSLVGNYEQRDVSYSNSNGIHQSVSYRSRPILEPRDLSQLGDEVVLITPYGYCRPQKCFYFKDKYLSSIAEGIHRYNSEAFALESRGIEKRQNKARRSLEESTDPSAAEEIAGSRSLNEISTSDIINEVLRRAFHRIYEIPRFFFGTIHTVAEYVSSGLFPIFCSNKQKAKGEKRNSA